MSVDVPTGVVLDVPQSTALLVAAIEEGLIDDPIKLDWSPKLPGVDRNSPMFDGLLRSALEQLMIGGRVYLSNIPEWCREQMSGQLFDEGVLVKAKRTTRSDEFPTLSDDIVTSMLLARGFTELGTFDEIERRFEEYQAAWKNWENQFEGRSPISNMEAIGKLIAAQVFRDDSLFPERHAFERMNQAKSDFAPVEEVLNTAQFIIECSIDNNALSSIPNIPTSTAGRFVSADAKNVHTNLHLVRIIDDELGPLPIGHNVSSTVTRAKSNAAIDFRYEMATWTRDLQTGELQSIEQVRKRAIDARNALERAGGYCSAGSLCTVIGFVTGGIGIASTAPFLAGLGLGASLIGGIVLGAERLSQARAGRWAMFVHRDRVAGD